MKRNFLLPALAVIMATAVQCKHDTSEEPAKPQDKEAPAITFTDPTDHAVHYSGDTIYIRAQVTDNEKLSEVNVMIHDEALESDIYNMHWHTSDKSFAIDTFYLAYTSDTTEHEIHVEAKDANNNEAELHHHCHLFPK